MRKFIVSLILVAISMATSFAQVTAKTYGQKTISPTNWSFNVTNSGQADSLGVYQDSIAMPIYIGMQDSVKSFFKVKLIEVTSPARVIVQLQSKRHYSDNYTTRQTITYTGVGSDSTIYIKNQAPYLSEPYKRLLFIRVNNKAYVQEASGWFNK